VRRITPGTLLATALWLVASGLLDVYIDHIGSFSATYGPIGAVVGIMFLRVGLGRAAGGRAERPARGGAGR